MNRADTTRGPDATDATDGPVGPGAPGEPGGSDGPGEPGGPAGPGEPGGSDGPGEPDGSDVPGEPDVARGRLVVRASGAAAAAAAILGTPSAPADVQVLVRCPTPRGPVARDAAGCALRAGDGLVLLTVPVARLTIPLTELRPLMFQPVEVSAALRGVVASAVAHVAAAGDELDRHGLAHHLAGLAELVLRSALRAELDRVDTAAARRRDALDHIRRNLANPDLSADDVAAALFVSRRRLYQLFDDGQGVSERIRSMRVDHAKALLADPAAGARGIADVSRECGFVSAAHFSRTFRKVVGMTPKEYRDRTASR